MTKSIGSIAVALLCAAAGGSPASAGAATIQTPLSGAPVVPGQTVTVTIAAAPGEVIERVSFATRDGVTKPADGVMTAQVPIPRDAVGPEFIVAYVMFADGSRAAPFVEVAANPGAAVSMTVAAPAALSAIGEMTLLEVSATFADGVTRDVTHGDRGTTYESSNTAVLGVDHRGLIQARSRGVAQVLVSSHGQSRVATVRVLVPDPPDNRIPLPDAGVDRTAARGTVVDLNGGASSDPDNQPLRFHWQQESGPAVILRDIETAAPYFIAPFVREATVLEFSLVVVDSRGATSYPDTVRITVTP